MYYGNAHGAILNDSLDYMYIFLKQIKQKHRPSKISNTGY